MGLFDLLGKVGKAVSQVQDAIKQASESLSAQQPAQTQAPAEQRSFRQQPAENHRVQDWPAYFAEILATEFPQYTVRRDVPVTELAGFANDTFKLYKDRPYQAYKAEWGKPYSFVLYQGGMPKGIVMLGSGDSHSRGVKYLIAREYAKKMGIGYANFYTQMPNEREYVIQRIRLFLGI